MRPYRSSKELSDNSIALTSKRAITKAQKWFDSGRQVYCVGRNSIGVILNFYPLCKSCKQTHKKEK